LRDPLDAPASTSTRSRAHEGHFKPLFRAAVGMPAHRLVLERRVERARVRLVEDGRITEVALETGLAHPSHLARCLRGMLGVTPSQLARSARTRS
jgi:AraC family transcriptional regulator